MASGRLFAQAPLQTANLVLQAFHFFVLGGAGVLPTPYFFFHLYDCPTSLKNFHLHLLPAPPAGPIRYKCCNAIFMSVRCLLQWNDAEASLIDF